jgi:hypothetical protein
MAPDVRSHQKRGVTALCPLSVLVRRSAKSSYLWGDYLCVLSPANSFSTDGRMDPAGFEPTSATWTECCVAVTPRALSGVCGTRTVSARITVTIFKSASRNGTYRNPRPSEAWTGHPQSRRGRIRLGHAPMESAHQPRVCSMCASSKALTARPFIAPARSSLTSSNTLGS